MTHTKQIISALLAVVLLLSLCACSGGGSSTADNSTAQVLSGNDNVEPQTSLAPQGDAIDQMISKMSVEEKVGQMFYALCPSVGGGEFVAQYHLGGCLLSGDFFDDKSADDVRATIRDIQSRTLVPLLFGVDEEGGTVVRVSYHQQLRDTAFDSPKNYYQNGGWEAVEAAETEKAELLTSLGINVNNAPVCDITSNTESFIYDRSFSGDVDEVNTFVKKVVDIYKSKKLGTVLKHFPGYGDNTDTHEDMSYDARSLDEFRAGDFIPFTEGINEGADCVMVAHNIMADVDEEYPASLSAKVHDIIRNELNFDGVIMTDDIAMQAIAKYAGDEASAVTAVKAGNDMICCSEAETQYPAVVQAVQNGEISEEHINASVKRILTWKKNLGLF